MRTPDFIVAGTQKAATTWLHECLHEHPEVFVPKVKEIHFFCRPPCRHSKVHLGIDWYKSQFPDNKQYKAVGEISIDYMYYDYVAKEIYELSPDMKIIFILRNPIERAYSAYWMNKRHKADFPEFKEFIRSDHHFIARGLYFRQIDNFLKYFKQSNLKILIYEDLLKNPADFIRNVYKFIGVEKNFIPPSLNSKIGSTYLMHPIISRIVYKQISYLLNLPPVLFLWRRLKKYTSMKGFYSTKQREKKTYPSMDKQDKECLAEIYREENEKLFKLINRNVSEWDINTTD